jgi:cation transport ATPase
MNSDVVYALLFTVLTVSTLAAVQSRLGYPGEIRWPDILCGLASAAIFVIILSYGSRTYEVITGEFGEHAVQIAIALVTILIGVGVHFFRIKNLTLYALVEIAFGVASAFVISAGLSTAGRFLPRVAALVGCAYIVGRGLENLEKARGSSGVTRAARAARK